MSDQGNLGLLEWAQLPITLDEWNAKVTAQHQLFKSCEPLPGVPKLLVNLPQYTNPPIEIAIASSSSRPNFANKIPHLPAITYTFSLNTCTFGDDVIAAGKKKEPALDIFLMVVEKINEDIGLGEEAVTARACLVFEDSIAGVEAGRRAGMRVLWVPHEGLERVLQGRGGAGAYGGY